MDSQSKNEQPDPKTDVYNVMIVDDSAFIRGAIGRALEEDPILRVTSSVSNGEVAIKSLLRNPVDVIVLDIEMPVMDGLTALPQLKAIDGAVQVIIASTLTQKSAEISLKAMSLGATDYLFKPSTSRAVMAADEFKRELIEKVKALGALARRSGVRVPVGGHPVAGGAATLPSERGGASSAGKAARSTRVILKKEVVLRKEPIMRPEVIAIGSSTGGPQALFKVIAAMGTGLPQPVVITQHMPSSFTAILAEHISRQCEVVCVEAKDGEVLVPGQYYIAPGDYHMLIEAKAGSATVRLTKDPQENFCRPSVDPMLRSLVGVYGKRILCVILTGMGQDGLRGSEIIVNAGGAVIAQDEATSIVWGMPGAVAMAGICSAILPLVDIGSFVRQIAKGSQS
jgi:two-component system chemotaxis response regulator CheB